MIPFTPKEHDCQKSEPRGSDLAVDEKREKLIGGRWQALGSRTPVRRNRGISRTWRLVGHFWTAMIVADRRKLSDPDTQNLEIDFPFERANSVTRPKIPIFK